MGPRDLVTIVHKTIDRDPARRYQAVGELAADLQRFLDDEPIQARRLSAMERGWRWCRHHPGVASLTAALRSSARSGVQLARSDRAIAAPPPEARASQSRPVQLGRRGPDRKPHRLASRRWSEGERWPGSRHFLNEAG